MDAKEVADKTTDNLKALVRGARIESAALTILADLSCNADSRVRGDYTLIESWRINYLRKVMEEQ